MRTDRQTDITKLIAAFRIFANAPKKMISKICSQHQKAGPVLYESQNAAVIQLSFVMGGGSTILILLLLLVVVVVVGQKLN